MESFKARYEQAKKTNSIRQLTAEYKKFEKKGDFIIGMFVGSSVVQSTLGGGEYNQYLFETDDGLVKFHLGRSGDGEIGKVLVEKKIYRIEFLGQIKISGGRSVNKFECEEIGFSDEFVPETEENE